MMACGSDDGSEFSLSCLPNMRKDKPLKTGYKTCPVFDLCQNPFSYLLSELGFLRLCGIFGMFDWEFFLASQVL